MNARDTRQLAAVLAVVSRAQDHPTAEDIFQRVRTEMTSIGLGTVYRNLHKLVAQGRLLRVDLPAHPARYDATTQAHDHFVCEGCGSVADLAARTVRLTALQATGYEVRAHSLTLFGLCPNCTLVAPALSSSAKRAASHSPLPPESRTRT